MSMHQSPDRRRTASAVMDAATGAKRSAQACTREATFACSTHICLKDLRVSRSHQQDS